MTERMGGSEGERYGQADDPDVPTNDAELRVQLRLVRDPADTYVWTEPTDAEWTESADTAWTEPADTSVETDASVEMTADDYAAVQRAVGRGAPTVLFGTSTRSLERSLAKLKAARQAESQFPPQS
jgi:hypothetical protein